MGFDALLGLELALGLLADTGLTGFLSTLALSDDLEIDLGFSLSFSRSSSLIFFCSLACLTATLALSEASSGNLSKLVPFLRSFREIFPSPSSSKLTRVLTTS